MAACPLLLVVLLALGTTVCAVVSGPIATEAQLRAAGSQGGAVTLTAPITLTGGELVVTSVLSVDGTGQTISAAGASRIFNIQPGGSLFVNGLTFSNAKSNGSGGAVLVVGQLALDSPVFTNNQALGVLSGGGAIAVVGAGASLVVQGGRFMNNTANFGGAIDVESGAKAAISFSTFLNNAAVTSGGAIQALDSATLLLNEEDDAVAPGTPNTFTGNSAPLGGAVTIDQASAQICGFQGASNTASNGGPNIYVTAANSSLTYFDFPATFITTAPGATPPVNQRFLGCPPLSVLSPAPAPLLQPGPIPAPPTLAPKLARAPAPLPSPAAVPPTPAITAAAPAPAPTKPAVVSPTPTTTSTAVAPTPVTASAVAPAPAKGAAAPATPPVQAATTTAAPAPTGAVVGSPCRNGGVAVTVGGQPGCACPAAFTGPTCEVPLLVGNPYATF